MVVDDHLGLVMVPCFKAGDEDSWIPDLSRMEFSRAKEVFDLMNLGYREEHLRAHEGKAVRFEAKAKG